MNLLPKLFEFLNQNCNYAVLRNFEGLPELTGGRDVDIVIEEREYRRVKQSLIEIITDQGWQIITYLHSDRLITYVCGRVDPQGAELVQLDFFFNTSIKGVLLMEAKELLAHKQFNGEVYHVSKGYEFLDKYLYNRAVGKPYPQKYVALKQEVCNNEAVVEKVRSVFSTKTIQQADTASGKSLLWAAVKMNLKRRPLGLILDVIRFTYTFIANYISSNTGFSVGFTGPDGSGKTTVLQMMHKEISPIFESAVSIFHFRPTLFGNLGEAAHSMGIKREVDKDFDNPHRGSKTGTMSSILRLLYYSVDYIVGHFTKVKSACRITRIVIFDRYYTDIIADSRRSRIYLNVGFLYCFGRLFIPRLDYNILLTADTDLILARKQELDRDGIESINKKMEYLNTKKGYYLVPNNGNPKKAVHHILRILFENQHQKNIKRLGVCKKKS